MSEWNLPSLRVDENLGQLMLGRRPGTCEGLLYNMGRWRSHSLHHWERPEAKEENLANRDRQGTRPKGGEHSQRSAGQIAANKHWCFLRGLLLMFCRGPVWGLLCWLNSDVSRSSMPPVIFTCSSSLRQSSAHIQPLQLFPASCCPAFQLFEA